MDVGFYVDKYVNFNSYIDLAAKVLVFFFQAEDGIRDLTVTGVKTCALPIYVELAREHLIEIHRHRLGVNGHDADGPPHPHDVGDGPHGGGMPGDLEGDVHADGPGPVVGELHDVGVGTDGRQPEVLQHLEAEPVHLGDGDARAALAAHHRDQRADRAAAEHEHGVARLHAGPAHVVRGDGERLDHRAA